MNTVLTEKQLKDIDIVHKLIRKEYVDNKRTRKENLRKKKLTLKELIQ